MDAEKHEVYQQKALLRHQEMGQKSCRMRRAIKILMFLLALATALVVGVVYQSHRLSNELAAVSSINRSLQPQSYEAGDDDLAKRFLPWYLGALAWTGNQVFAFYGLAQSCREFSSGGWNAASCVWGAISTAVTFIGGGLHGYKKLMGLKAELADLGNIQLDVWKRGETIDWKRHDKVIHVEETLSSLFGTMVSLDGFVSHDHPKMKRMALDKDEVWPVFHLQNPLSTSLHFTITAFEEDHAVMSLGFGRKQNSTGDRSKRESYQGEYFTSGGIDFTDCFNAEPSPYQLNTGSDYQNVMKELECNFPDLENLWGTEVQLYDPNLAGTIGSGSVAAFRGSDHASSISVMPKCPSGIRHTDRCTW